MNTLHTVMAPPLQLKGTNFGIRVTFSSEVSDDALVENFASVPRQSYELLIGSGLVLDFQSRRCSEELVSKILSKVVWPKGLNILAWLTSDEESKAMLSRAGFITREPATNTAVAAAGSVILTHSLRSGQREDHPGSVVLVGHLNEGSEIFAGGSVSILGKMKGLVHAGRKGTAGVYVIAGSFEAKQLRIGDRLCDQIGVDMKWWKKPVIITLEDDSLLFRDWKLETGNEPAQPQRSTE